VAVVALQRRAVSLDAEAKRPGRQNREPEVAKTQQKQLAKITVAQSQKPTIQFNNSTEGHSGTEVKSLKAQGENHLWLATARVVSSKWTR
jgi:hypothetical protein